MNFEVLDRDYIAILLAAAGSGDGGFPAWLTWGSLVAAVVSLTLGVLFRLGRVRGIGRYYRNPQFPYFTRNFGFSMLPAAAMCFLFFMSTLIWETSETAGLGLFACSMGAAGLTVLLTHWPPDWLKPRWIKDGEDWNPSATKSDSPHYSWKN
jgi:hypothetical protein